MSRTFRNAVIALLQELYDEGPAARSVLIRIGYPKARIPAFSRSDVFWTEVVLTLEKGILVEGIRQVLAAALADNPGSTEAAALLTQAGGKPGHAGPAVAPAPVLVLLSDPARDSKLRLDREARLIGDVPGLSVTIRQATRVGDIITALRRSKPQILHFAGHGLSNGDLIFEDDSGGRAEVALPLLAEAIAATVGKLECVVLNSCYTAAHAEAFRGVTRTVAGAVVGLPDDTALSFAKGFYEAVGDGEPVREAFGQGRAEANLAGNQTSGLHFVDFDEAGAAP